MAIALVQHKGGTSSVTFAGAQTAGNTNVVGVVSTGSAPTSCTDTLGNSYTLAASYTGGQNSQFLAIFVAANIKAAAANGNAVSPGGGSVQGVVAVEVSGLPSPTVGETNTGNGAFSTPTLAITTTGAANQFLFGLCGTNAAITGTSGTFTFLDLGGTAAADAYQIVTALGTYTLTFSSSPGNWNILLVGLVPSAAVGAVIITRRRR